MGKKRGEIGEAEEEYDGSEREGKWIRSNQGVKTGYVFLVYPY